MKTKLTHPVCNLLLAVLISCRVAAASEPPASPELTATVQPYLDSYDLAGVVGIVADKTGKVHFKNLLGYADVEAKKPIREDNVFWIASMTKMFAGASIMMLVDEGKVSLDDSVTNFIPQLSKWMVVAEKDDFAGCDQPVARALEQRLGFADRERAKERVQSQEIFRCHRRYRRIAKRGLQSCTETTGPV